MIIRGENGRILGGLAEAGGDSPNLLSQEKLDEVFAHFAIEVDKTVTELDDAMFIALVSFSFPFQMLAQYLYSKNTKRNFNFRSILFFDLGVFICVLLWFEKFEVYIHR